MCRAFLLSLLFVFCSMQTAFAQEDIKLQSASTRPRIIIVSSDYEVLAAPDKVTLLLSVKTTDKSLISARKSNQLAVKRVMEVFPRFKIDKNDLQTASIDVQPVYAESQNQIMRGDLQTKPIAYSIDTTLRVVTHQPDSTNSLINAALDAGANSVSDVKFETTELKKHEDKARLEALRAVRQKAESLTGELGLKLGKPLEIHEGLDSSYSGGTILGGSAAAPMLQGATNGTLGPQGADATSIYSAPVAIGLIPVSATMTAVFEME